MDDPFEPKILKDEDVSYDLKNDDTHVCCLCECNPPNIHLITWKCPIFKGERICSECCLVDALRDDIDQRFSEKLGRKIAKDEINEECKKCGRNCAAQSQEALQNMEIIEFTEEKQK